MGTKLIRLADLVDQEDPASVLREVRTTILAVHPRFDFEPVREAFESVRELFAGRYPGFQRCNTKYHDVEHTTDTFLAMARLMHGAHEAGRTLDERMTRLGLVSALLHDTGYIQKDDDRAGTGAKYTSTHIRRSIEFAGEYLSTRGGYSLADLEVCRNALLCTGLEVRIGDVAFREKEEKLVGLLLGTADLLGQMASRKYLEKLPTLYQELREGWGHEPENELLFLKNTLPFYRSVLERFAGELGNVHLFMRAHFRKRWGIDRDLYRAAIEEHMIYLESILRDHPDNYAAFLKRSGPAGKPRAAQAAGDDRKLPLEAVPFLP
jgi:hypothetical protein